MVPRDAILPGVCALPRRCALHQYELTWTRYSILDAVQQTTLVAGHFATGILSRKPLSYYQRAVLELERSPDMLTCRFSLSRYPTGSESDALFRSELPCLISSKNESLNDSGVSSLTAERRASHPPAHGDRTDRSVKLYLTSTFFQILHAHWATCRGLPTCSHCSRLE